MSGETRQCRDDSNELLPWYLNGTLEARERDRVEAHLGACPICRTELEELSEVSQAMSLHQESAAQASPSAPDPDKSTFPAALGWVLAASVSLLVLLGVVAYLRRPPGAPSSRAPAAETAILDLGSGPSRGTGSALDLRIGATTRRVELSFLPPIDGTNDYEIFIFGPDQTDIGSWPRGPLALDQVGRARVSIEAGRFSRTGEHQLLVRHYGPAGEPRDYTFPFTVSSAAPR